MANSTTNLDEISSSQASKEVTANALFDAGSPSTIYGRRASTTTLLTWGFYGGYLSIAGTPTAIANGTVALTASNTNYVVASRATGAVSSSTATTNWNSSNYIRLYAVVTDGTMATSYTDHRSQLLASVALVAIAGLGTGVATALAQNVGSAGAVALGTGTADGTNTGDVILGAIGSTPNANGVSLTGQALTLQPASASFGGVVTTGTQTFTGPKTINEQTDAANNQVFKIDGLHADFIFRSDSTYTRGIFLINHAAAPTAGRGCFSSVVGADTYGMFAFDGYGKMLWGAGGSTDYDTMLYRSAANILKTDDAFTAALSVTSIGATSGIGYATGAGSTVTQTTNRTTGVTLSYVSGTITTDTTSLAAGAFADFTVTNTAVAITDDVRITVRSGSNSGNTTVECAGIPAAGSFVVRVWNQSAATAETGAIVFNVNLLKGVAA